MKSGRNLHPALSTCGILALAVIGKTLQLDEELKDVYPLHRFQNPRSNSDSRRSLLRSHDKSLERQQWIHTPHLPDLMKNCNSGKKTISFGLKERGASGGFGDRLLGVVTTYYVAIMTDSAFEVQWTQPYNLSDYFSIPSCAFRGPDKFRNELESAVTGDGTETTTSDSLIKDARDIVIRDRVNRWEYFTNSSFLEDVGRDVEIQTNSFHWKDVVRHPEFEKRAASLGLSNMSQAELFKEAIDVLLGKPTRLVKDSYESVLLSLAGGHEPNDFGPLYVGVQIRLGGKNNGVVSGWEDPLRHSFEDVQCFAKEAMRLCRQMHIRSIFLTADSEEAARAFEDAISREHYNAATTESSHSLPQPNVVQVPGSIAHTDLSNVTREHATDVWLKSILDWWVLKHATALVVSRSGFGETAAMASGAQTALRLKIAPGTVEPSKAESFDSYQCSFFDLTLRERDVLRWPYE